MPSSRLKHFCELCRKQCKDENGFKCHINSHSHQQRVRQYANNPQEHIEKASQQFEGRFIQLIKTKYPGQPKHLQQLYNQLIQQKKFLKLSHTQWATMGDFGNHLRQVRNILVTGNPPNCRITYTVSKTKQFIQTSRKEKAEQQRQREKQQFQKSIAARVQKEREDAARRQNELNAKLLQLEQQRTQISLPDKLELNIQGFGGQLKRSALYTVQQLQRQVTQAPLYKKKMDKIEQLYQKLKKDKESSDQQQAQWIRAGITVRIKPHQIDQVFHNKKCKINKIVEPYVAEVTIGTATIQIDQSHLQTVIPKSGNKVMIVQGQSVGKIGLLKQADVSQGYGVVLVDDFNMKVPFNFISRYDAE